MNITDVHTYSKEMYAQFKGTNTSKIPRDSVEQLHGNKHSRQETNPESCSCFVLPLCEAKDMLLTCSCLICK